MFSTQFFKRKKCRDIPSQDRVFKDISTFNEQMNLRCGNAAIKEIVHFAVECS